MIRTSWPEQLFDQHACVRESVSCERCVRAWVGDAPLYLQGAAHWRHQQCSVLTAGPSDIYFTGYLDTTCQPILSNAIKIDDVDLSVRRKSLPLFNNNSPRLNGN